MRTPLPCIFGNKVHKETGAIEVQVKQQRADAIGNEGMKSRVRDGAKGQLGTSQKEIRPVIDRSVINFFVDVAVLNKKRIDLNVVDGKAVDGSNGDIVVWIGKIHNVIETVEVGVLYYPIVRIIG